MLDVLEAWLGSDFMPHGQCYLWDPGLVWLHAASDTLIALAYYLIPIALIYFVRKRRDLEFSWMFLLFGAFILLCGTTHALGVWTIWNGTYWLTGTVKLLTGVASLATAVLLMPLVPQALKLPSPAQLQATNEALRREVQERERAETLFRNLLESAPDAMVITDEDGFIIMVNAQTERLFGYDRDTLIGQSVEALVPERFSAHHQGHRSHFMKVPKLRPMEIGRELFGLRQDGTEFPVEISLSPLETEGGRLVSAAIRDITDRKEAEQALAERAVALDQANQKLRESERLKDEFFANASHELRTPLTLILAPLEALLSDEDEPLSARQTTRLRTIHNNATRLFQLVTGLLDFSRLEAGHVTVNREPVDLVALTHSLLADFRPVMEMKKLENVFESNEATAWVEIDRYLYERILFNLLSNAVKFTPEGGGVRVALNVEGDQVRLSVQDTGIGISPVDQARLFEKFRQLEGSSTRRFEGSGLGLALVKEFVELMEGTIYVESQVGQGSTFTVTFTAPAASEVEMASEAPVPSLRIPVVPEALSLPETPDSGESKPRLLIAEDNPEMAAFIVDVLGPVYDTRLAMNGDEAWEMLQSWTPDLILSDVMMPGRDGLQLCQDIKQTAEWASIPVVLLTALTNRQALLKGWEAGADEYLYKPFHPNELATRVRTLLALAQARRDRENWLVEMNTELERRVKRRTAELEHAKAQAEEMARLKSIFLANMSHEIRTPLTGIIGFAAVLAREASGRHSEFADLIARSGKRLLDTLSAVLNLAKLEADRIDMKEELLVVAEEACETVELFHKQAEEKGIVLGCEVDEEASHATAVLDRGALGSILHNLIGNALKFTDEGAVVVHVEADADRIYLHVRDTGIGIAPEKLPQLFREFVQGSSGWGRSHEGVGLGLAITKRLVELMGGDLSTESELGKGSTFTASFPRLQSSKPLAMDSAKDSTSPSSSADVLIVEDNREAAMLLQVLMEDKYQVTLAPNGEAALQEASQRPFDLILMDINLGEGPNGVEVMQALRQRPEYKDRPIIAMTAYAMPGDRENFLNLGFSAYLSKPFPPDDLFQLSDQLLN